MKKILVVVGFLATLLILGYCTLDVIASPNCNLLNKSGCCSHHHGVCGCSNGKSLCCDGTISKICTCNN